ncbi:hypothetical protein BV898_11580 [Hypsibius exemplaris]|uniref:Uncharacterized protein n=1 Tax=Hypsibius exemplaris TaxID=2072580 RepID=A0A1W0WG95_HYPEX|nr:hypothetical protein BV898_11580 [Hypsibius exemplaris]
MRPKPLRRRSGEWPRICSSSAAGKSLGGPRRCAFSMIHAGSLSSMAEEGAEEVVQFNIGGRDGRRKGHGMDDDEEEEVLQMRAIAPSATAPHLDRIDERSINESENGMVMSGRAMPRSSTVSRALPHPATPDSAASAASDVQSPRQDYQPETTPEQTPLMQHRPVTDRR